MPFEESINYVVVTVAAVFQVVQFVSGTLVNADTGLRHHATTIDAPT